jgi:hypothetical protein
VLAFRPRFDRSAPQLLDRDRRRRRRTVLDAYEQKGPRPAAASPSEP